jgi:hypothetical protein
VILYEDDNYIIKASLSHFLTKEYITLNSDDVLYDSKRNDPLYSTVYFEKYSIHYVLADFLENGHCYFYNKIDGQPVLQVMIEYWDNIANLSGSAGRRFYIYDDVLFLYICDIVS